jgi:hypothetical protein
LLLQSLRQIVRPLAQLVEQTRVLDGDDGLGSEVLDKLDLLVAVSTTLPGYGCTNTGWRKASTADKWISGSTNKKVVCQRCVGGPALIYLCNRSRNAWGDPHLRARTLSLRGVKPLASKNPRIDPVAGGNARRGVLCHFRLRLGEVLRGAHRLFVVLRSGRQPRLWRVSL